MLFYFINLNKLFSYLKNNYPAKYQELGEPSLSNMSSYRLLKFVFFGQSFQKEDANLQNFMKKPKILLFSVCIILAIGFINFFVFFGIPSNAFGWFKLFIPATSSSYIGIELVLIISALTLFAVYVFNINRLFNLLKNSYQEKYQELGRPTLWHIQQKKTLALFKFLRQSLPDENLALARLKKKVLILLLSFIAVMLIAMLVSAIAWMTF
ncbi:hypothetical protein KJ853_01330 [Patescibacteria group bacterium]|nr:hypothetical protein [Patescibacteria group bacterium]